MFNILLQKQAEVQAEPKPISNNSTTRREEYPKVPYWTEQEYITDSRLKEEQRRPANGHCQEGEVPVGYR